MSWLGQKGPDRTVSNLSNWVFRPESFLISTTVTEVPLPNAWTRSQHPAAAHTAPQGPWHHGHSCPLQPRHEGAGSSGEPQQQHRLQGALLGGHLMWAGQTRLLTASDLHLIVYRAQGAIFHYDGRKQNNELPPCSVRNEALYRQNCIHFGYLITGWGQEKKRKPEWNMLQDFIQAREAPLLNIHSY